MQKSLKLVAIVGMILFALSACKKTDNTNVIDVTNTNWTLITRVTDNVSLQVPTDSVVITLAFGGDNTLGTNGSCNGYGGEYKIEGDDELTVFPLIGTLLYCEVLSLWEGPYIQQLEASKKIYMDGELLVISKGTNDNRLIFKKD